MFSSIYCFLAICLLGAFASDDWSYCTCKNNVNEAKEKYEARHDAYFQSIDKKRLEWLAAISERVDQMHKENGCHNTYYTKSAAEFNLEMLAICGGVALGSTYDAPWKKREMTDEEVCSAIATKGPVMCAYIALNDRVVPGCEVSNTFDKYIWPNYNECAKNCTEQ